MIDYRVDGDGVAILTWDVPGASVNTLSDASTAAYVAAVERALADPAVKGIVVTSAKKDFLAGADVQNFLADRSLATLEASSRAINTVFRRLETAGKPMVAAINGTALGGGLELALACHYRVAADNPKTRIGFPEVTLGVLPGAGGTQRLPRLIGIRAAVPLLVEGKRLPVVDALKAGIVNAVVPAGELIDKAKAWILSGGKAEQPWDRKGFRVPGGDMRDPDVQEFMSVVIAKVHERTCGNYPAPLNILSCVYEGVCSPIEVGLDIESRYFGVTASTVQAENLIRSGFLALNDARKLKARPKHVPKAEFRKVGVLGAGLMGSGIAHACATAGLEVVLLDREQALAERGKAQVEKLLMREVERGKLSEAERAAVLARITPTTDYAALAGCELVIEAVFEQRQIKAEATRKTAAATGPDILFASNTSTLPITGLAEHWPRPENFIGLHFFSPVHRMALVEVIRGRQTSDACLAKALDFVARIGKTPVVVNDSRGFFTSRVFSTYFEEGMAMLAEGVAPALLENAGRQAGMPLGPLAVADEVALDLLHKVITQTRADLGSAYTPPPSAPVIELLVEKLGRLGKKSGQGFYDYTDAGRRLWPGLAEHFPRAAHQPDVAAVKQRLLHIQAAEAVRCLAEGVVGSTTDGDVASLLGWGFPAWAGGVFSYIDTVGVDRFVADCEALAARAGPRFAPPALLKQLAGSGRKLRDTR
ncbi:3-hydroxyacyl-CoA dehydrogenase NAD-binding domain-containing protein [Immundisolibacter sp.]|uniref:3-hydroxyacyl-CoA dehydrogenase NAD-binding domain-containing protein n=1 Tax=Immundisolibacter sp. TaxID=1934948 RepID=UPI002607985D|nr:3-hydroxyacyl-CoA dehydrogenase NAD-binding domain-containing protein [Immundisolibacter sp.]MDD3650902.1 3-hydroxyacyl-CoA dehydrogenase NAD-binding domain-containing protein [Immundisolibacter sp.]